MKRPITISAAGALLALTFALPGTPAVASTPAEAKGEAHVFSGDAYDNEMGIRSRPRADGIIAVLIG